eukprot:m.262965 g.262965  ORF g.262965 m.262965 type:complete len:1226 (+) comp54631_c0_seq2:218-3895(+)
MSSIPLPGGRGSECALPYPHAAMTAPIESAVKQLLHAALENTGSIVSCTSTVVNAVRDLLTRVSEQHEDIIRDKLTKVVASAKAVSFASDTIDKLKCLGDLGNVSRELIEAATIASDGSAPLAPYPPSATGHSRNPPSLLDNDAEEETTLSFRDDQRFRKSGTQSKPFNRQSTEQDSARTSAGLSPSSSVSRAHGSSSAVDSSPRPSTTLTHRSRSVDSLDEDLADAPVYQVASQQATPAKASNGATPSRPSSKFASLGKRSTILNEFTAASATASSVSHSTAGPTSPPVSPTHHSSKLTKEDLYNISDLQSRLDADIARLRTAIRLWDATNVSKHAASTIENLWQLLRFADGLKESKNVMAKRTALTTLVSSVRSVANTVSRQDFNATTSASAFESIAQLHRGILEFVEAVQHPDPPSSTSGHIRLDAGRLMRLEETLEDRATRIFTKAGDQESGALQKQFDVTVANVTPIGQKITNLFGYGPSKLAEIIHDVEVFGTHALRLLELHDSAFNSRTTARDTFHSSFISFLETLIQLASNSGNAELFSKLKTSHSTVFQTGDELIASVRTRLRQLTLSQPSVRAGYRSAEQQVHSPATSRARAAVGMISSPLRQSQALLSMEPELSIRARLSSTSETDSPEILTLQIEICAANLFDFHEKKDLVKGASITIHNVTSNINVKSLKSLITSRCSLPAECQMLMFNGQIMKDDLVLSEFLLTAKDLIFLFDSRERNPQLPTTPQRMASEHSLLSYKSHGSDPALNPFSKASSRASVLSQPSQPSLATAQPVKVPQLLNRRPSEDDVLGAGKKKRQSQQYSIKRSDLPSSETDRVRLMVLVKTGKISLDEMESHLKGIPSAKVQLALQASIATSEHPPDIAPLSAHSDEDIYGNASVVHKFGPLEKQPSTTPAKRLSAAVNQGVSEATSVAATSLVRASRRGKSKTSGNNFQMIKEGTLDKLGSGKKVWKTRWFVLTTDALVFFDSPRDSSALGTIPLSEYQSCRVLGEQREHTFGITPIKPNGKAYALSASSGDEMRAWMTAIDSHIPLRRQRTGRLAAVQDLIGCIVQRGVTNDIFRIPGSVARVKQLLQELDSTGTMNLTEVLNAHILANTLKKILKDEHIDPLMPKSAQVLLARAFTENPEQARAGILIAALDVVQQEERIVLTALLRLFKLICENEAETNMNGPALALAMGPALFTAIEDEEIARDLCECLIEHLDDFLQAPREE